MVVVVACISEAVLRQTDCDRPIEAKAKATHKRHQRGLTRLRPIDSGIPRQQELQIAYE
jgi:hypothetical protein